MAEKTVIIPRPPQSQEKVITKKPVNRLVFLLIGLVIILVGLGGYFVMTQISSSADYKSASAGTIISSTTPTLDNSQDPDFSKQTRDIQRLRDAQTLVNMLKLYQINNPNLQIPKGPFCSPSQLSAGRETAIDGSGWLPINFKTGTSTNLGSVLPSDPGPSVVNRYIYHADGKDSFELSVVLESKSKSKLNLEDGGDDPSRYELGTSVAIDTTKNVCPK